MENINDEVIEQFLLGKLSSSEEKIFKEKLKSDKTLQAEVQLQKQVLGIIDDMGDLELWNRIQSISKESIATPKNNTRSLFPSILYYAAAAILLGISIYILFPLQTPPPKLFASNYVQPQLTNTERNSSNKNEFKLGMFKYQHQKYAEALTFFHNSPVHDSIKLLFIGAAHLELNQNQQALNAFQKARQYQADDASWYLALTYLKINDVTQSKIFLKECIDRNNQYANKAKAILDELK